MKRLILILFCSLIFINYSHAETTKLLIIGNPACKATVITMPENSNVWTDVRSYDLCGDEFIKGYYAMKKDLDGYICEISHFDNISYQVFLKCNKKE